MALQHSLLCFKNVSNILARSLPRIAYWKSGYDVTSPVQACGAVYSTTGPNVPPRPLLQTDAGRLIQFSQLLSSRGSSTRGPKKPLTSYFLFKQEFYPKLARTNPNRSVTDISKELGQQWKNLPHSEREKYIEAAKQESLRYKQQRDQLSAAQKEEIHAEATKRRKHLKAIRLKKQMRELHRPKRPPTQYNLFMRDRVTTRGVTPPRDFMKQVAMEWRALSPEQKQPYKLEAAELLKQYSASMTKWEEQMKNEGHPEFVRGYRVAKPRTRKTRRKKAAKKAASRKKKAAPKKALSKKTAPKENKPTKKTSSCKSKKAEEPEDVSWMREE